jgi:hypothetical protein
MGPAVVTSTDVMLFGLAVLAAFFLLFGLFIFSWWITQKEWGLSPYTRLPLRRATGLSYANLEKVYSFLDQFPKYENPPLKLKKASFCRETGRIFPNSITWYDVINVDWNFISKRHPGHYVSWGSLSDAQKRSIRKAHGSLDGFQVYFSSPHPSPKMIEEQYVYAKPGPLYVEINTGTLVGWKAVPDTDLEVLVVQKPDKIITISVSDES